MRRIRAGSIASALCALIFAGELRAAPFTPGNVAVFRKVPTAGALHIPVFVDEYTPGGQLVQSLPMPTTTVGANRRLVAESPTGLDGNITRSVDGRYLTLAGLDAALGNEGTTPDRVIARVDALGTIDTTTALTDAGSMPRGAVTLDGSGFFLVGSSQGVRYATLGATTSTQIAANPPSGRNINVFGGQLYASTATPTVTGVVAIGSGTSTAPGQSATSLPGIPGTTDNDILQFFFADLDAATPGLDTLYLASHDAPKLSKYTLANDVWTVTGTVGAAEDEYRGLTGVVNGAAVTLYATRTRGTVSELVTLTDASGFNGTLTATPTLLAATTDGSVLQGVAFTPVPEPAAIAAAFLAVSLTLGRNGCRKETCGGRAA